MTQFIFEKTNLYCLLSTIFCINIPIFLSSSSLLFFVYLAGHILWLLWVRLMRLQSYCLCKILEIFRFNTNGGVYSWLVFNNKLAIKWLYLVFLVKFINTISLTLVLLLIALMILFYFLNFSVRILLVYLHSLKLWLWLYLHKHPQSLLLHHYWLLFTIACLFLRLVSMLSWVLNHRSLIHRGLQRGFLLKI